MADNSATLNPEGFDINELSTYYSLISLSGVQNVPFTHSKITLTLTLCFYLSVWGSQNVVDWKSKNRLEKFLIRAASVFTQFCIVCQIKLLGVIQIKSRVWEVKMCVQVRLKSISLHVAYWRPWRMTFIRYILYIVYITTNLLISKTKYRLNVTAWKVYQNNNLRCQV